MALIYLVNKSQVLRCIARWLLFVLEYEFIIVYKLGYTHVVSDELSRLLNIIVLIRVHDQITYVFLFMLQLIWLEDVRICRWVKCLGY
jgi:hypothetical protein